MHAWIYRTAFLLCETTAIDGAESLRFLATFSCTVLDISVCADLLFYRTAESSLLNALIIRCVFSSSVADSFPTQFAAFILGCAGLGKLTPEFRLGEDAALSALALAIFIIRSNHEFVLLDVNVDLLSDFDQFCEQVLALWLGSPICQSLLDVLL